jgi:GNAT superfamily N-acetyltransferase
MDREWHERALYAKFFWERALGYLMAPSALVRITMLREHLEDLPHFPLPSPFSVRYYEPGDVDTWLRIQHAAEVHRPLDRTVFDRAFGPDEAALGARQCFLCGPDREAIGTATAWFDHDYHGRPYGRVHWVAILPAWQGQGLSKPLLCEVCNRLRQLHHQRAYLVTHTARIPAIRLYLRFGFRPDIRTDEDALAWDEVRGRGVQLD